MKGLELTSDELTEGTYSKVHSEKSRKREIASSESSSDSESSTLSSTSHELSDRTYSRSSSNNNCGVIEFEKSKFAEDQCELRLERLTRRSLVMVDSCRGGTPPECHHHYKK